MTITTYEKETTSGDNKKKTKYIHLGIFIAFLAVVTLVTWLCIEKGDDDSDEVLCSIMPVTYSKASIEYPDISAQLAVLESYGIATWYSDRIVNGNAATTAEQFVASCPVFSRLNVVVYGLPNKDCSAGYSNGNSTVQTTEDYRAFLTTLVDIIGYRKVLYTLEPDAVGLLATNACAEEAGYLDNLLVAMEVLSVNDNAEIYVDVGYWTLMTNESAATVASIVQKLGQAGKLKGITLNTSNYQSSTSMAELCGAFQVAVNSTEMHCNIDTSRNFQLTNDSSSSEWCNLKTAGIGAPPTDKTGYDNIDYFLWIKPPGDSDGTCVNQSSEAMRGPEAGVFFYDHFVKLWNQGYFVNELGNSSIDDATSSNASASASGSS